MWHGRVDFMHNSLFVAKRLGSEAVVWRCSAKYGLLYDEKSFEKFQQRSSFLLAKGQVTGMKC